LRPPSDFSKGLFNSTCRPESNGDTVVCSTEADQENVIPMEMMKRLLKSKGLHQAVFFHDVRWGGEWGGRFIWVLLNSGSSGAYAFNHKPGRFERSPFLPPAGRLFSDGWGNIYTRELAGEGDVGQKLHPRMRLVYGYRKA
jgi:hypothetical protein